MSERSPWLWKKIENSEQFGGVYINMVSVVGGGRIEADNFFVAQKFLCTLDGSALNQSTIDLYLNRKLLIHCVLTRITK